MKRTGLLAFCLLVIVKVTYSQTEVNSGDMPALKVNEYGIQQLYVNAQPYLILGGELLNSSGFDESYMEMAWERIAHLNVNTVFVPISWQQFEPVEGRFNDALLQEHISNAREHHLKLVILWFGAWKNGVSSYAPPWVLKDTMRFQRVEDQQGVKKNTLSVFSENVLQADLTAYKALVERIREIDHSSHTVIMLQIENEVGLYGQSRDYSSIAESAFQRSVPDQLADYLNAHQHSLTDNMKQQAGPFPVKERSWQRVFGQNVYTDEIFMSYHYARYINTLAQAGKEIYPLPVMVNAWQDDPGNPVPGKHLSGGPVARMLDIWMAGGPAIDLFSPDIYHTENELYKKTCRDYRHNNNPLLIPEACAIWLNDTLSAPSRVFYSVAECDALGFSPFGIDHPTYHSAHAVKHAYKILDMLSDEILKHQGSDRLTGFLEGEKKLDTLASGEYLFVIDYRVKKKPREPGYGLILQVSENLFMIAGTGFNIQFLPRDPDASGVSILQTASVIKNADGTWESIRFNGGDETLWKGMQGLKFPPNPYDIGMDYTDITIQKAELFIF